MWRRAAPGPKAAIRISFSGVKMLLHYGDRGIQFPSHKVTYKEA